MCVCVCVCVCVRVDICVYTYIYIYIEREREMYIRICICSNTCILYIYIYIYAYTYVYSADTDRCPETNTNPTPHRNSFQSANVWGPRDFVSCFCFRFFLVLARARSPGEVQRCRGVLLYFTKLEKSSEVDVGRGQGQFSGKSTDDGRKGAARAFRAVED